MSRPPPPFPAPAHPPFGPLAGPLARAKPPARSPHSLSLTSQPHLPAPLARALPLTGRPAPPVSHIVFLAYDVPSSPHRRPLHRRPLAAQEEFGTAPSSPLDQRPCPVPPRRLVSSVPLCGINVGAVHLTGARRAPPLPSPRAPIKRSPRAPPSPHRPRPLPSSPLPSAIREAPPSSPSPVSSPPLLSPSPLVQRAIKLTEQLPHNVANSKHHFPAPVPRPKTTGGDPRREAPPPPRGQPPLGPL